MQRIIKRSLLTSEGEQKKKFSMPGIIKQNFQMLRYEMNNDISKTKSRITMPLIALNNGVSVIKDKFVLSNKIEF